jgi:hypothetical protein
MADGALDTVTALKALLLDAGLEVIENGAHDLALRGSPPALKVWHALVATMPTLPSQLIEALGMTVKPKLEPEAEDKGWATPLPQSSERPRLPPPYQWIFGGL